MRRKELVITIESITAGKKHTCGFCGCGIVKGAQYTRITSRIAKTERFPVQLKFCRLHDAGLLPMSLLWKRS